MDLDPHNGESQRLESLQRMKIEAGWANGAGEYPWPFSPLLVFFLRLVCLVVCGFQARSPAVFAFPARKQFCTVDGSPTFTWLG